MLMKPILKSFFTGLFLFCCASAFAQQTGLVEYKSLGLSFQIPDGWVGQEANGSFLMGSNTVPGFILLTTNEAASVEVLKQEARAGMVEQNGTNLQMNGTRFESVGSNGIGTEFTGTLEYQAAKAYIVGMVNPYGSGVTIISATLKDKYSSAHRATFITPPTII